MYIVQVYVYEHIHLYKKFILEEVKKCIQWNWNEMKWQLKNIQSKRKIE